MQPSRVRCSPTWTSFVRGDIYRLKPPRNPRGHEQHGERYAVVVQSDDLLLSTVLVAPTSRSAIPRVFRPTITIGAERTQVLVEQTAAVAPERLGALVGHVSRAELNEINSSLRLALELD
jgi:mRNA interferase MazF